MSSTKNRTTNIVPHQKDRSGAEGTGGAGQCQQKSGQEHVTKPTGTKTTGRSISSAKNIASYMQKQQPSLPPPEE